MSKQSTILLGIDFFESSIAALSEALRLQQSLEARLIVMHVIDNRIWGQLCDDFAIASAEVARRAKDRLRYEITESTPSTEEIETVIAPGHPVEELLGACQTYQPDLLMLGAKGMKDGEDLCLGHVASRLVRHAPSDIMIVRKGQTTPFRKIVACIDFSPSSEAVIKRAIEIADAEHAELTVTHVIPHLHQTATEHSPLEALGFEEARVEGLNEANLIKQATLDLESLVKDFGHLVKRARIDTHVIVNDRATRGLLEFGQEGESDLFVLGKHGKSALKNVGVGATIEKVANEANCSILAVS